MDPLPSVSISEQWGQAFARPTTQSTTQSKKRTNGQDVLPVNMQTLVDARLVDDAGL